MLYKSGSKTKWPKNFIMDNDPSQGRKTFALEEVEAEFHKIPARSPDLNSISKKHFISK